MYKHADIILKDECLHVSGVLDFYSVPEIYHKSLEYLSKFTTLNFDFSETQSSDSAGLALIIEWIKYAKQNNKAIAFHQLSEDILSIAKAADLDLLINAK